MEFFSKIRGKFFLRSAVAAVAMGAACAAVVFWRIGAFSGPLLRSSLATPQFRFYLAIAAVCLLAISVIVGVVTRKRRKPLPGSSGTIILEFTLVLPILLMLSLMLLQCSLVLSGHLCVTYAGFCAARSAIVQLPQNYSAEPTNYLDTYSGSQKMTSITNAACWAVMPVCDGSYSGGGSVDDRLQEGFDTLYSEHGWAAPHWVSEYLANKLAYAKEYTTVTVDAPIDGDYYGEHEDIKVNVTHDLYLAVPYADAILAGLDSSNSVELEDNKRAIRVKTTCTLTNQGTALNIQVEEFPKVDYE